MALTVEDGTGLADADSYFATATADAYHTGLGNTAWTALGTPAKESAARRGTSYVDRHYAGRWPGARVNGRTQRLAWPRTDVEDSDGEEVADDEVPAEVVEAAMLAALREGVSPGSLAPDEIATAVVKKETVGPLSVEYAVGTSASAQPVVTEIDSLLWSLLLPDGEVSVTWLQRA